MHKSRILEQLKPHLDAYSIAISSYDSFSRFKMEGALMSLLSVDELPIGKVSKKYRKPKPYKGFS